jgi:hypothetical protein
VNASGRHTILDSIRGRVFEQLLARVVWVAREHRNLADQASERFPLVVVLGREHYSERRESYPALSRRDLLKVLDQEEGGSNTTLRLIGPAEGDRRDVTYYRLDDSLVAEFSGTPFIVPEGLALAAPLDGDVWVDVERQGYRYFLLPDGVSQPAGGMLPTRELVAMARGIDPDREPELWRGSDKIGRQLAQGLTRLDPLQWWDCRNPLPRPSRLRSIAWRPLATMAGGGLIGYLMLSSLYLQASLAQRESTLQSRVEAVSESLQADEEAQAYQERVAALADLWSDRVATRRVWRGVGIALNQGATISRVDLEGRRVSVRGSAPDAAEILAALSGMSEFADVAFEAPVRRERTGRQAFAVAFTLSGDPSQKDGSGD